MRKIALLLIILGVSQIALAQVDVLEVEEVKDAIYEEAENYFDDEEYEKAVEILKTALTENENNASYHVLIGGAYSLLDKKDEAKEHIERAITLNPDDMEVYLSRFFLTDDFEEQMDGLKQAIKKFPREPAFYALAFTFYKANAISEGSIGNTDIAIKYLEEYRSLAENYFKVIESQSEPLSEEIQLLNSMTKESLETMGAWVARLKKDGEQFKALNEANRLRDKGELEEAIKHYDMAINISDAFDHWIYNHQGHVYKQLGNFDQALLVFSKAIEITPQDASLYRHRAQVHLAKGNEQKAFEDFQAAIDLDPKDGRAYIYRGLVYKSLGQFDKAILDFSKAIEINDEYAYAAYGNRSEVYRRLDKFEESKVDINKAFELKPEAVDYLMNVGLIYLDQGKFEEAIAEFNKRINDDLHFASAYVGRYFALKAKGDISQAQDDLEKVRELDIGQAEYIVEIAKLFEKANMIHKSLKYMNYAIEINPELEVKYEDYIDVLKSKLADSK